MGTLYVVGAPAGDLSDLTLRARRILGEVVLVAAEDVGQAQTLLDHYQITAALVPATETRMAADVLQEDDVALLLAGLMLAPAGAGRELVRIALAGGHAVVPIPGPALPLTALVTSGLPADSFVYLGQLPQAPAARGDLLASVARERRTLVALVQAGHLSGALVALHDVLGSRPLVILTASGQPAGEAWRGTLEEREDLPEPLDETACALVIGGAQEQAGRWEEDRLEREVQALLAQGLRAKEIGQRLSSESGWPRREIYRRAVEQRNGKSES